MKIPYTESHKIIESIEYKLCRHCHKWFPLNEKYFNRHKNSKDGFSLYCKECIKKEQKDKYKFMRKLFPSEREPDVKKIERIGETNINRVGTKMEIVEYENANSIMVGFFNNEPLVHTSHYKFRKGEVKSVYDKTVYGVGYLGIGSYNINENGVTSKKYKVWNSMIQRCYDFKFQENSPTYKGCAVIDEWHNFQNFAKWYDENYYEVEGYIMHLDKDILYKGNKIYSPSTCVFTPNTINILFIENTKKSKLPIGVAKNKNKYTANCTMGKGRSNLGSFRTPNEAFNVYKEYKEMCLKQVADEYKDKIPQKLYDAIYNYKVEITD